MLINLFNEILYRPLFNALVFLYNIIPGGHFGLAVILLTILIRVVLLPLSYKSIKSRQALSGLQPEIKEIQKKYKEKEKQSKELMKLYKEKNINPFSGCLPLLIQLPVLIALYRVLINVLNPESLATLYSFVVNPGIINPSFLGVLDLSGSSPFLAVIAGLSQFFYSKIMIQKAPLTPKPTELKSAGIQQAMNKQMLYFMPLFTILIAWNLPAGLPLYWIISTLLGLGQEYYFLNKNGRNKTKN